MSNITSEITQKLQSNIGLSLFGKEEQIKTCWPPLQSSHHRTEKTFGRIPCGAIYTENGTPLRNPVLLFG